MEHLHKHFPKSKEDFEEMTELIADETTEKVHKNLQKIKGKHIKLI